MCARVRARSAAGDLSPASFSLLDNGYVCLVEMRNATERATKGGCRSLCGLPSYRAPEMLRGEEPPPPTPPWAREEAEGEPPGAKRRRRVRRRRGGGGHSEGERPAS